MAAANDVRFGLSSSIFTTDAHQRLPLRRPDRGRHRAHQQRHPGRRGPAPLRGDRRPPASAPASRAATAHRVLHRGQDRLRGLHRPEPEERALLSALAALAIVWLAAARARRPRPRIRQRGFPCEPRSSPSPTGTRSPLRNWTLSYDYVSWERGPRRPSGIRRARRRAPSGSASAWCRIDDAVLTIRTASSRRETLVDGRPQPILSSSAREVTVTTADGQTVRAKVEPPHREPARPRRRQVHDGDGPQPRPPRRGHHGHAPRGLRAAAFEPGRVRRHPGRPGGEGPVPAMTIFRQKGARTKRLLGYLRRRAQGQAGEPPGDGLRELPHPLPQARRRVHGHRGLHDAHRPATGSSTS